MPNESHVFQKKIKFKKEKSKKKETSFGEDQSPGLPKTATA